VSAFERCRYFPFHPRQRGEIPVVHILRSVHDPSRRYVGSTADVQLRLNCHNAGQNRSTAGWKPWTLDVCIEFTTEELARRFERYLKSGSGHAFAQRHFCSP
jgi:predicted GIY-YIG superfamily endonuclease